MKGGFNNPPNLGADHQPVLQADTSMKGGFNNPPNKPRSNISNCNTLLQ